MREKRISTALLGALALALAAAAWLSASATAEVARLRAQPTAMAVISINNVLDQLREKAERETDLGAFIDELQSRVNAAADRAEAKKNELDILPRSDPQYTATRDEFLRLSLQARLEKDFAEAQIQERRKRMLLELFEKIRGATSRYAQREGYQVVLMDDSDVEIPADRATPDQVQGAIVSRRVLYSADGVNISDAVATMMNNEF